MYICIYRNADKQRVFNVSQTGIYRYTDEKYIQKKREKGGECHMLAMTPKEKAATASVYGIQATAGVKPYLTATEKKC